MVNLRRYGYGCAATVFALAIAMTACGSPSSQSSSAAGATGQSTSGPALRIGYAAGVSTSVQLLAAQRQGYFTANGVEVDLVPLASSAAEAAAIAAGSVDAITIGSDAGFSDIVKAHLDIIQFAGYFNQVFFMVGGKSACTDAPFPKDLQALVGKNIGLPALGTSAQFITVGMLAAHGVSAQQVHFVQVANGAPSAAALENGSIAATVTSLAVAEQVKAAGGCILADYSQKDVLASPLSGSIYGGYWVTRSFANAHEQVLKGAQRALIQSTLWLQDTKNQSDAQSLISSIVGNVPTQQLPFISATAISEAADYVDPASLTAWYQFDVANKIIPPIQGFAISNYLWKLAAQTPAAAVAIASNPKYAS